MGNRALWIIGGFQVLGFVVLLLILRSKPRKDCNLSPVYNSLTNCLQAVDNLKLEFDNLLITCQQPVDDNQDSETDKIIYVSEYWAGRVGEETLAYVEGRTYRRGDYGIYGLVIGITPDCMLVRRHDGVYVIRLRLNGSDNGG